MCRRLLLLPLLAIVFVQPAAGAKPATSWAQPQIRLVTQHGLMGGDAAAFRPDDPLTQQALAQLVADLTQTPLAPVAAPSATVTVAQLDSRLVHALGLTEAAREFAAATKAAGLAPPSRLGTEVVARLLGLRTNHPAAQDVLELLPNQPATRAEAAYSAAQILQFSGWEQQSALDAAALFALPELSPLQKQILHTAVKFVGYPYIWSGESETPTPATSPFGSQVQGGFDCSGFVWRVYKLQSYPDAPQLAGAIRGRTTMQMSGEVPKSQRIALADVQPGDVLFFGARGTKSKPTQIDHAAIALGNGWLIQSSRYGVALAPLDGWYAKRFAWARRPLVEVGPS